MSSERVVDVIDHVRTFYSQLSEYYEGLSAVADQERVKILLDYLIDVEREHERVLAEYEESAPQAVINTWLQYEVDTGVTQPISPMMPSQNMDVDSVVREALRLDQCLSDLYKQAIVQAQTDRVKELFSSLLKSNEHDMRRLVRDSEHLQDW